MARHVPLVQAAVVRRVLLERAVAVRRVAAAIHGANSVRITHNKIRKQQRTAGC